MDKRIPLAALFLFAAFPAAAEFCSFDGAKSEISVRRLKDPSCTMDNALVFNALSNENRYGEDEKKRTFLTDSWPGWGGSDQKCAAARGSASKVVYGDETYILGKAVLMGPQVWRFNGSCDDFRSKFLSKQRALAEKGDKPDHEDVFKAAGAEDVGMSALVERLVEGKKPKKN